MNSFKGCFLTLLISFLFLSISCSDDSENKPKFINANELNLELNHNGKVTVYEGGFISGRGFKPEDTLVYQSVPINYLHLKANQQPDTIVHLSLTNFRFFPLKEDSTSFLSFVVPSITNNEIMDIIKSTDWKFNNSRSRDTGLSLGIAGRHSSSSEAYSSIEATSNFFNINNLYTSQIYYSGTDKISEEEYVILHAEFSVMLKSTKDTIQTFGTLKVALNESDIGNIQ